MRSTGRPKESPHRSGDPFDRLGAIRARPVLVEFAVRTALVDAMKWRLGGGAPPAENSFAYAAAAAARQELSRSRGATAHRNDATSLARTAATAAASFFRSPLGRRLMTLPQSQITATAAGVVGGADVAIRDAGGRLHLIALTALARPLEIGARAHDVARSTPLAPRDRLCAVRIHMYSLVTGMRHESTGWNVPQSAETVEAERTA